jgi:hypothetical protein
VLGILIVLDVLSGVACGVALANSDMRDADPLSILGLAGLFALFVIITIIVAVSS